MRNLTTKIVMIIIAVVFALGANLPNNPVSFTSSAEAAEKKKKKRHPGKRFYMRKTCMACHGKGGIRSIQDYPNIAGQPKKYLAKQIKDILSGKRLGGIDKTGAMRTQPMVGALVTADRYRENFR